MKKLLTAFLLVASFFVVLVPFVFDNWAYGLSPPIRWQLQEQRQKIATKTAQERARSVEGIKKVFDKILSRYNAAQDRLNKILAKIESRINKLSAKGVDTQAAETALLGCADKRTQAASAILDAKAKIGAIDPSSSSVREAVKISVEAIQLGKSAIFDYHRCLVAVSRILRASVPKEGTAGAR